MSITKRKTDPLKPTKKEKEFSPQQYFDAGVSELETFLENNKVKRINKAFRIDGWSTEAKTFVYMGIGLLVLALLSLFTPLPYICAWLGFIGVIVALGFVYAKPDKGYNFLFLLFAFMIVVLFTSPGLQSLMLDQYYQGQDAVDQIWLDVYTADQALVSYQPADWVEGMGIDAYVESINSFAESLGNDGSITRLTVETHANRADYSSDAAYERAAIKAFRTWLSNNAEKVTAKREAETNNFATGWWQNLEKLTDLESFMNEPTSWVNAFQDVLNWIFVFAVIGFTGSTVAKFVTAQFGEGTKRIAFIALAIAVLIVIYTLEQLAGITPRTVWDTVGSAWNDLLAGVGLGSPSESFTSTATTEAVVSNTVCQDGYCYEQFQFYMLGMEFPFKYYPSGLSINSFMLLSPFFMAGILFIMAVYYRHKSIKSMLFVKAITREEGVRVKRAGYSIPLLVLMFIMGIYMIAYFLINGVGGFQIDPFVSIIFYVFSLFVVGMFAFDVLILIPLRGNWKHVVWEITKYTIVGLFSLFAWFQMIQPTMNLLGLSSDQSGLLMLSQDPGIINHPFTEQFFLVAMPETLAFQIGFVGLGNRVYYYLRRSRAHEKVREQREEEKAILEHRYFEYYDSFDENDISQKNLRELAMIMSLKLKIDKIDSQLDDRTGEIMPKRFFIIPTIIFGVLGSVTFSYFHAFRRYGFGWDVFWMWWQNPMLGLNYFGAGFLMSVVSFFCPIAAILIHVLNNWTALVIMGVA